MNYRLSMSGVMGSAVVAAMFAMGACEGSKTTDPTAQGGGTGEVGGGPSAETGGTPATGNGGAAQGGATGAAAAAGKAPFDCKKAEPAAADIAPGTSETWGTTGSITGGTFAYQQDVAEKVAVDTATTAKSIILSTSMVAGHYVGYGLYFKDPAKCFNVSKYAGISMMLSGTLGGGKLVFQLQQNSNYPIDTANSKGACVGDWSDGCANHESAAIEVTATPTEYKFAWSAFTGGLPEPTVDPSQLLGVQWQINCPSDATANCTPALTIGAVSFY